MSLEAPSHNSTMCTKEMVTCGSQVRKPKRFDKFKIKSYGI